MLQDDIFFFFFFLLVGVVVLFFFFVFFCRCVPSSAFFARLALCCPLAVRNGQDQIPEVNKENQRKTNEDKKPSPPNLLDLLLPQNRLFDVLKEPLPQKKRGPLLLIKHSFDATIKVSDFKLNIFMWQNKQRAKESFKNQVINQMPSDNVMLCKHFITQIT